MQRLHETLEWINRHFGESDFFVYFLIGTGIFFTLYLKFPQIRYFRHAIRITRGRYDKATDVGDTTHFQALATALSGTVGTGNIAGVAFAIYFGGPAALFWMLVTAAVGMTTKFVEVTLSHKYREKAKDGSIAGGPMYYMKNKMKLKWLAVIFAVATVISSFGTGNLPQINSIANSMFSTFGIPHPVVGFVLMVLLSLVIIGGIKRIAQVTSRLVPFMAIVYFFGALSVIIYNYENILPSFWSIFSDAFTGTAATGGFIGASVSFAFNKGVARGLFSNEAGQGSAPIAHASAKAHEPVSEGMVAILEPFIDTIIICTLTGLVLLSSGVWHDKIQNQFQNADLEILAVDLHEDRESDKERLYMHLRNKERLPLFNGRLAVDNGTIEENRVTIIHARSFAEDVRVFTRGGQPLTGTINVSNGKLTEDIIMIGSSLIHSAPLTAEAFTRGYFGRYGQYIVSIGILLFAFSTAISWSYYGDRAMTFLFGLKSILYYRIAYVVGFFLASFTDTSIVWTIAGITIAMMTIPNLFGILFLHRDVKSTIKQYWVDFKNEYPDEKTPE
jgi:alanine or glycine:cation symporter, AGCS family